MLDYGEWVYQRPIWLQIILWPILVPVMLIHSMVGIAFFILVFLPFLAVTDSLANRRFWGRLRSRGQVANWGETANKINRGAGTLIVEIAPKGPGYSWLVDRARDEIDPD